MKTYRVYIASGISRTLYTGVTDDLERRMREHKSGVIPGFTSRYRIHHLVYYEEFADIEDAIEREKEIRRSRRERKLRLIESRNPGWADLSDSWVDHLDSSARRASE